MNKNDERRNRLMPNDIPRYIRCYDGDKFADRYTVVYTGNYPKGEGYNKSFQHVSMSEHPSHPQGVGMHGESETIIDRPTYSHLGKKIKFNDLPSDCKKLVISDYKEIWSIK